MFRQWLYAWVIMILALALLSLSGSLASGATFVPAGATITASEPSYLLTEEEVDAVAIAYQAKEVEAAVSAEGIVQIMAIVVPIQAQVAGLSDTVARIPDIIRVEAKKAYWQGFKDGSILGFIAGAGITYAITQ